jgi:Uma2 family endonuclease
MEYVELVLKQRHQRDPNVYVSCNTFLYYQQKPRKAISPDIFLVRGVPNHLRDYYVLWEEGKVPAVTFEFTAKRSKQIDSVAKKDVYEAMGVKEYYIFDPTGEFLNPRFRAYRLNETTRLYEEVPTDSGVVFSPELNLELIVDGMYLRLRDVTTGQVYPMPDQWLGMLESEKARAEDARARAEAARARADDERARAEDARARADELEEKTRRLEQRLRDLGEDV